MKIYFFNIAAVSTLSLVAFSSCYSSNSSDRNAENEELLSLLATAKDITNGAIENGAIENGAIENGAIENGAIENGAIENGVIETTTAGAIAQLFATAMYSCDLEKMLAFYPSEERSEQASIMNEKVIPRCKTLISSHGAVTSIKVVDTKLKGKNSRADVKVEITFKNGFKIDETYLCCKNNGKWHMATKDEADLDFLIDDFNAM